MLYNLHNAWGTLLRNIHLEKTSTAKLTRLPAPRVEPRFDLPSDANPPAACATHAQLLSELEDAANRARRVPELEAELRKYRNAFESMSEERIAVDEEWRVRYDALKTDAQKDFALLMRKCASQRRQIDNADADRRALKEQVEESMTRELNRLRAELGAAASAEQQMRAKYQASEAALARAQQQISEVKEQLTEMLHSEQEQKRAIEALQSRCRGQDAWAVELRQQLAQQTAARQSLRDELAAMQESAARTDQLMEQLDRANQEIAHLRSHLATASLLQDEWRLRWNDLRERYQEGQNDS